jgi:hypothetical protein
MRRTWKSYLQAQKRRYAFNRIKVKNPNYSQAVGRTESFDRLLPQR